MKRILLSILVLVVVGLIVLGIRHGLKMQARKKREAAYQTALRSYRLFYGPWTVAAYLPAVAILFLSRHRKPQATSTLIDPLAAGQK